MPKYVYLMKGPDDTYKIGKSTDPRKRLEAFKTLPYEIRLWHVIQCDNSTAVERCLHTLFTQEGKHIRGEWFRLSHDDVRYLQNINSLEVGESCDYETWNRIMRERGWEALTVYVRSGNLLNTTKKHVPDARKNREPKGNAGRPRKSAPLAPFSSIATKYAKTHCMCCGRSEEQATLEYSLSMRKRICIPCLKLSRFEKYSHGMREAEPSLCRKCGKLFIHPGQPRVDTCARCAGRILPLREIRKRTSTYTRKQRQETLRGVLGRRK